MFDRLIVGVLFLERSGLHYILSLSPLFYLTIHFLDKMEITRVAHSGKSLRTTLSLFFSFFRDVVENGLSVVSLHEPSVYILYIRNVIHLCICIFFLSPWIVLWYGGRCHRSYITIRFGGAIWGKLFYVYVSSWMENKGSKWFLLVWQNIYILKRE